MTFVRNKEYTKEEMEEINNSFMSSIPTDGRILPTPPYEAMFIRCKGRNPEVGYVFDGVSKYKRITEEEILSGIPEGSTYLFTLPPYITLPEPSVTFDQVFETVEE